MASITSGGEANRLLTAQEETCTVARIYHFGEQT
jgi:hypothetical protein